MRRVKNMLAAALCLAAVPIPALADEPAATGTGSAGAVDVVVAGQPAHADPIAPCATGTTAGNASNPILVGSSTRFGSSNTTCTRNADGTAAVSVSGQLFATKILLPYGGPEIRAWTFKAFCNTTQNGSQGRIELSGLTGVNVPSTIPANYLVTIPGSGPDAKPLADVVLNELIVPNPPNGSLVMHAIHIKLFPQGGGPASGDIFVGSTACDPYGW